MIYAAHIHNVSVSVDFNDTDLSRMHHALGNPLFPLKEHYRNHFSVNKRSNAADELASNPNWEEKPSALGMGMMLFYVTERGKSQLAAEMAKLKIPHKLFHTEHPTAGKLTIQAPTLNLAKSRMRHALLDRGDETKGSIDAAIATMNFTEVK